MKYFRVSLGAVYTLYFTAQKMKFSIKESLMENFIFCASLMESFIFCAVFIAWKARQR